MNHYSLETELNLLGILLNSESSIMEAKSRIKHEDFFHDSTNRMLYRAIVEASNEGKTVNPLTIDAMVNNNAVRSRIYECASLFTSVETMPTLVDILAEKYIQRVLLTETQELIKIANNPNVFACATAKLDNIQQKILNLSTSDINHDNVIEEFFNSIESQEERDKSLVNTKIDWYDNSIITERGYLHVIGATPASGKTSLILTTAVNQALNGIKVVVFIAESKRESVLKRIVSIASDIPQWRINGLSKGYKLNYSEEKRYQEARQKLNAIYGKALLVYAGNDFHHDLPSISALVHSAHKKMNGLDNIYIDHLQRMNAPPYMKGLTSEDVKAISENIKICHSLALRYNCLCTVLSQLGRAGDIKEGSKEKMPTMRDLKGSSTIEQEAHIISFLHMMERGGKDKENKLSKVLFYQSKNREGELMKMTLDFNGECTKFVGVTRGGY